MATGGEKAHPPSSLPGKKRERDSEKFVLAKQRHSDAGERKRREREEEKKRKISAGEGNGQRGWPRWMRKERERQIEGGETGERDDDKDLCNLCI